MKINPINISVLNNQQNSIEAQKRINRGIVDKWDCFIENDKVKIDICIDAFLYPFWETSFDYDNTAWNGVEKYRSISTKSIKKLNELGYIIIDDDVYPLRDKKYGDVYYPFEVSSYQMIDYVIGVMEHVFGFEVYDYLDSDELEKTFNFMDDYSRGCWGVVENDDKFYQNLHDENSKRNYNMVIGVDYFPSTKDWENLTGTTDVQIIYYISSKELVRHDFVYRQNQFAKKVVDALFGKVYTEQLEKTFC